MSTRKKIDYVVEVLEIHGVKCKVRDYLFYFELDTMYNGRFLAFDVARKDLHKCEVADLTKQALSLFRVIRGF